MGTRFRFVRWLPWALALALLPATIVTFPGASLNWTSLLQPVATGDETSP
ncbi:MAG: hypothetical protein JO255_13355, partial [Alphaproteobacteria bacterium]|nr:hypothetical protein [Alphaproteobacteria bacterium]